MSEENTLERVNSIIESLCEVLRLIDNEGRHAMGSSYTGQWRGLRRVNIQRKVKNEFMRK